MEAQVSFDLWEGLQEARSDQKTTEAMQMYAGFFIGIEHALLDSFVVILYSILETRSDTVSIPTLVRALACSIKDDETSTFNSKINALKPIWKKFATLRNEVVGHQSLANSIAESFNKVAVTPEEIRNFLSASQELLGQISSTALHNCLAFNIKSKPSLNSLLAFLRLNNV